MELFTKKYVNVTATMAANAKLSHLIFVVLISAYLYAAKVEGAGGKKTGMRMGTIAGFVCGNILKLAAL